MRCGWLLLLVCCSRTTPPHLEAPPSPPRDAIAADAGPLQPTRRLPGPCLERIAWGGNPADRGIERHIYDPQGRILQSDFDGDADGKVTRRVRYSYPAADRVVIETDAKADGTFETSVEAAYTDNTELWAEQCSRDGARCDRDGHGNILGITTADDDRIELDYGCWP
jgi:hypothetical protein